MQALLITLPRAHYSTLQLLIHFFREVCLSDAASFDQTAARLAVMFGDALCRRPLGRRERRRQRSKRDAAAQQELLVTLIKHEEQLFRVNPARMAAQEARRADVMSAQISEQNKDLKKLGSQHQRMKLKSVVMMWRSKTSHR